MTARPATLRFGREEAFSRTLKTRVNAYFAETGLPRRDAAAFYLKAMVVAPWMVLSYAFLVFAPIPAWQVPVLALSLGLALIVTAFNIFHDAGHGAASRFPLVNNLGRLLMDLTGVSSYVWIQRHNTMHHVYPNIHGFDSDIDVGPLARLSPHQPHRSIHRFQHLYLWPLYGLYFLKWQFVDDVVPVVTGRIGILPFRRPKGTQLAGYVLGKLGFLCLAFVIPMVLHPAGAVVGVYFFIFYVNGMIFVCVVQLSHLGDCTDTPRPEPGGAPLDWAVHQARASSDYCQQNRLLSWLLGGLNFQIEHHLFPRVCHVHYPALAPIVRAACAEFGVPYHTHRTLAEGLRSHHRHLRGLAQRPA